MAGALLAEAIVTVDRRPAQVMTYRLTDKGQLCRFRFVVPLAAGVVPPPPDYVELLSTSPRVSHPQPRETVA